MSAVTRLCVSNEGLGRARVGVVLLPTLGSLVVDYEDRSKVVALGHNRCRFG